MFKSSSLTNYAPTQNPTFTGKVTLPDGSSITKSTSSYLTTSAASSTYAPIINPTFTGLTNNTTSIQNNANLAQVGTSTFTGAVTANGGHNYYSSTWFRAFKYTLPPCIVNACDLCHSQGLPRVFSLINAN